MIARGVNPMTNETFRGSGAVEGMPMFLPSQQTLSAVETALMEALSAPAPITRDERRARLEGFLQHLIENVVVGPDVFVQVPTGTDYEQQKLQLLQMVEKLNIILQSARETIPRSPLLASDCDVAFWGGMVKIGLGAVLGGPVGATLALVDTAIDMGQACF